MAKYKSAYTDTEVTAAQYIVEKVCENKARSQKAKLTWQFWKNQTWARFFQRQIPYANGLLRIYDASIILHVVKKNNVWALNADWVAQALKAAANSKVQLEVDDYTPPEPQAQEIKVKRTFNNKRNLGSKLDG